VSDQRSTMRDFISYMLNPRTNTIPKSRKLQTLKVESFRIHRTVNSKFSENAAVTQSSQYASIRHKLCSLCENEPTEHYPSFSSPEKFPPIASLAKGRSPSFVGTSSTSMKRSGLDCHVQWSPTRNNWWIDCRSTFIRGGNAV